MRTTLLLSAGDCWPLRVAGLLADRDEAVTVVLLDRGADLARPAHPSHLRVTEAIDRGVDVLVDSDALRRRGIAAAAVAPGIKPTDVAAVGDLLVDGTDKVVWL